MAETSQQDESTEQSAANSAQNSETEPVKLSPKQRAAALAQSTGRDEYACLLDVLRVDTMMALSRSKPKKKWGRG